MSYPAFPNYVQPDVGQPPTLPFSAKRRAPEDFEPYSPSRNVRYPYSGSDMSPRTKTTLASLPPELADRICAHLGLKDLKGTLLISRAFQYASERASGAFSEFRLSEDTAEKFMKLYDGRRWEYLQHLRFAPIMPSYDDTKMHEAERKHQEANPGVVQMFVHHYCREGKAELRKLDEAFSQQIKFLFDTIVNMEARVCIKRLRLTIYSPTREIKAECPHRGQTKWRVHLLQPELLPHLASIFAFRIEDEYCGRGSLGDDQAILKVDLRVMIDLAAKLPRLEYLGCNLDAGTGWTSNRKKKFHQHYLRDWAGPLRDTRHDFAKAVETVQLPSTLSKVDFNFIGSEDGLEDRIHTQVNHHEPVPDLVSPAKYDPFSSSLRVLSQGLTRMKLRVLADKTLFWPDEGSGVIWPNLESISVQFQVSSPSGRWYFQGPDNEGRNTKGTLIDKSSYPPLEDGSQDAITDAEYDKDFTDRFRAGSMSPPQYDYTGLSSKTQPDTLFRVIPNNPVLNPFLSAFATAAQNMPSLREACLWAPLAWDHVDQEIPGEEEPDLPFWAYEPLDMAWAVAYSAPGARTFKYWDGLEQLKHKFRYLFWSTGTWRPTKAVRDKFKSIGPGDVELMEYTQGCTMDRDKKDRFIDGSQMRVYERERALDSEVKGPGTAVFRGGVKTLGGYFRSPGKLFLEPPLSDRRR